MVRGRKLSGLDRLLPILNAIITLSLPIMASNRTAVRRGTTPAHLSIQAKPIISVEDWEAKAPLGDLETRSVNLIKAAGERAPLPLKVAASTERFFDNRVSNASKFSSEGAGPSRPSTPIQRNRVVPNSRPGTPQSSATPTRTAPLVTHALHPKQPVQTPQQFYDWFALIDRSVAHSQEAHFRAHVANVSEHLDTCDQIVERIDEVDREVAGMLEGWRNVEEGGKSLKDACEQLLEERVRGLPTFPSHTDADYTGSRTGYWNLRTKSAHDWNISRNSSMQHECSITQESRLFCKPTSSTWSNASMYALTT